MILTTDQLRQFVDFATGDDADAAMQLLLDATEADIVAVAGAAAGNVTELVRGGWSTLVLSRPIASVSAIMDDVYGYGLALASDDYRFDVGGFVLTRLWDGTNPGDTWGPWVTVTYTAADTTDSRVGVQIGLVRLMLAYHPGILSQRIGDWEETYQATNSVSGYATERAALLNTLSNGPRMAVI